MALWKNPFKSKKDALTKYQNNKLGEQGEIYISPDNVKNIFKDTLLKEDKREKDGHIKGLRRLSRDEADAQILPIRQSGELDIYVGGVKIPQKSFTKHLFVSGQNGSGKTTLLKQIMAQTLTQIGKGSDQRAIIYDPKGDFVSFIFALCGNKAPIKILNPFDDRCFAWDICKDIQNRAQAATVAKIFVPEPVNGGSDNRFFRDGARTLIRTVQESFQLTSLALLDAKKDPLNWTLRDLCLALRETDILREVLSRHDETRHALEFLDRSNNEVLTTAKAYLSEIEIIAAAWEGKEKFSLKDFRDNEDGMILILGSHREANSPLQALNSVIIQRATQMLLTDEETRTRRSWIFLDEFTSLGKIDDFQTIMQEGRSKGVCNILSFQNIETVRHLYTKEIANAIASECATKIFLKCEGAQAAWVDEFLGKREVWRMEDNNSTGASFGINDGTSESHDTNSSQTTGITNSSTQGVSDHFGKNKGTSFQTKKDRSENWRIKDEPVVSQGELAGLPEAGELNGVAGFFMTSAVQGIWEFQARWNELSQVANLTSNEPNFKSREHDPRYQYLKSWDVDERAKFGTFAKRASIKKMQDLMTKQEQEELHRNAR
jgi:energy-coupling factor transporter ATP-binding protein EcfA2